LPYPRTTQRTCENQSVCSEGQALQGIDLFLVFSYLSMFGPRPSASLRKAFEPAPDQVEIEVVHLALQTFSSMPDFFHFLSFVTLAEVTFPPCLDGLFSAGSEPSLGSMELP